MESEKIKPKQSLYPEVIQTNPNYNAPQSSTSPNLYPTIDMKDLVENLFPDLHQQQPHNPRAPSAPPVATEEVLIKIPGALLNLIDKNYSVELACGDLSIVRLRQGDNVVAVLARVSDEIQWPLTKDSASVKLDDSHYFFSLKFPNEHDKCSSDSSDDEEDNNNNKSKSKNKNDSSEMLNYGLTIASKGQEMLVKEFDEVLEAYSCFSVQKVAKGKGEEGLFDALAVRETSPGDLKQQEKKETMEGKCAAYWTTLAPNVEDYSGSAAKVIAAGSGHLIKGILWCGDVTVDRLQRGNEVFKKRMSPTSKSEISPDTMKRIRRVKRMTKMTEKVAIGVLSGVLKVSGFFTSSVANSKVGRKFFGLLPGEIILASLDGFNKVCDAVEVAGRNVMSTSSNVTTELVNHRYGEEAAEATNESLGAAGHAFGTAWAAFKIRKAFNPKNSLKPTTLAKSAVKTAAAEIKSKKSK
ncbi:protein EARLY-RESPONSIVE TO DEHYDRATION 7, chloroplastic-like [Mercurialis annua]|uniref:protein EARLY-RESPONSIVE TO DEHYDRATION 7, chloroplastic-like n=1 Tax=Mercurialis annua TaxID=3986 RepID=UPI00215E000A|nr:protein EARLY-RESPONSIVE TO DEHYDRATION 7, chloroplastic-like [Mercurialis annua]